MTVETPRKLTRDDLVRGKKKTEDVYFEELGGTLTLRPLTDWEWTRSQSMILSVMKPQGDVSTLQQQAKDARKGGFADLIKGMNLEINIGEVTIAEWEQAAYITACGVVDPKLTVDQVKEISPPGVVKKIAAKIIEMSLLNTDVEDLAAQVAEFRSDQ